MGSSVCSGVANELKRGFMALCFLCRNQEHQNIFLRRLHRTAHRNPPGSGQPRRPERAARPEGWGQNVIRWCLHLLSVDSMLLVGMIVSM